ncbi:MAG TPA: hypothetical protein VMT72_09990 [Pseudolabrys sp.]|nr:hypothetical protein [Pseudolabrys sp.]
MTIFLFSGGIDWHLRTAPPGEGPSLVTSCVSTARPVVRHTIRTGQNVAQRI